jgi:DNA-directed RNA polymerase subunit N (RpoN/RPB10)
MRKNIEIRCPCCGELITPENNLFIQEEINEQEVTKILNDLNIEFG